MVEQKGATHSSKRRCFIERDGRTHAHKHTQTEGEKRGHSQKRRRIYLTHSPQPSLHARRTGGAALVAKVVEALAARVGHTVRPQVFHLVLGDDAEVDVAARALKGRTRKKSAREIRLLSFGTLQRARQATPLTTHKVVEDASANGVVHKRLCLLELAKAQGREREP